MFQELGILAEEAKEMSAEEFAKKHASIVRPWGNPPIYEAVEVLGTDYLWKDGLFDGWDKFLGGRRG